MKNANMSKHPDLPNDCAHLNLSVEKAMRREKRERLNHSKNDRYEDLLQLDRAPLLDQVNSNSFEANFRCC